MDLASLQLSFQVHGIEEGRVHLGHLQKHTGQMSCQPPRFGRASASAALAYVSESMKTSRQIHPKFGKAKESSQDYKQAGFFFVSCLLEFGPGVFAKCSPGAYVNLFM